MSASQENTNNDARDIRAELDAWGRHTHAKHIGLATFADQARAGVESSLEALGLADISEFHGNLHRAEDLDNMLFRGAVLHRAERRDLQPYREHVKRSNERLAGGEEMSRPTTAAGLAIKAVGEHGYDEYFAHNQIRYSIEAAQRVLNKYGGQLHDIAVEEATDAGVPINVRVDTVQHPGPDFLPPQA